MRPNPRTRITQETHSTGRHFFVLVMIMPEIAETPAATREKGNILATKQVRDRARNRKWINDELHTCTGSG